MTSLDINYFDLVLGGINVPIDSLLELVHRRTWSIEQLAVHRRTGP